MTKGERIRKLREEAGISQVDLALRIGVSKQTLYKYEYDIVTNIPSDKIEAIATVLRSSPAYIMGWDCPNASSSAVTPEHIALYEKLNDEGQEMTIEYMKFLISQGYIKSNTAELVEAE